MAAWQLRLKAKTVGSVLEEGNQLPPRAAEHVVDPSQVQARQGRLLQVEGPLFSPESRAKSTGNDSRIRVSHDI